MSIKNLFTIIDLILITLAIYLGVSGVYGVLTSKLDTLPPVFSVQTTATPKTNVELPPFSDYRIISQRNLFQTKTETEDTGNRNAESLDALEKTDLNLKLWGTIAGTSENSYAVIENTKDKKQKVYKVKDLIQDNVQVKLILADKVVLSVSGKDEKLLLEQRSGTSSTSPQTSARVTSTATASSTTSKRTISLNRSIVENAMENLSDLMTQVTIEPYSENGLEGLKLSNIKPNSLYRRMGLRNGDVLTAVDGQPIASVDQALKLYEDLKSSDTANVEISRKGRSTTFQYKIR